MSGTIDDISFDECALLYIALQLSDVPDATVTVRVSTYLAVEACSREVAKIGYTRTITATLAREGGSVVLNNPR